MKEQHKKIIVMVIVGTIILLVIASIIKPKNILLMNQKNGNESSSETKKVDHLSIKIHELNNTGQSGTAEFTSVDGGKTRIDILVNSTLSNSQPVYIQQGACTNPAIVNVVLVPIINGKSSTIIEKSINELTSQEFSIVVHHSLTKLTLLTACGDIKNS